MTVAAAAFFVCTFWSHPLNVRAAGTGAVSISSAAISGDNVVINISAQVLPDSDDGQYYIFAEKPYQDTVSGGPVASVPLGMGTSISVPLQLRTEGCHLYDKFQVAVKQGGAFVPVSGARYITNPEVLATSSPARKNSGKKGLILDGAKIGNGNNEAVELGVQQAAYNINISDVVGGDGGVEYIYNGKTYHFDSSHLSQYDHAIRTSTEQGMGMTIVLLNPHSPGEEFLLSPSSRDKIGIAPYYMMNTSEDTGLEYLEAVVSYLAMRYNGQLGFGQVDNWVIANEVNAKNGWNYSSITDEASYVRLYADSFRVCYNAIKSRNANAYVCISVDHNWTAKQNSTYYGAKGLIEAFNANVVSQGNIDWGVAAHPYNYPMTWTSFWSPKEPGMITHSINTPYMSMENIEQLTDFLSQGGLRNTKGAVRPVLLTEIGYTSTRGEEAQAAAIVYAYQRCMNNQYIKLIAFNRQTDFPLEVSQGMSVGLTRQDGSRKLAFEYYQQMNGPNAAEYVNRAAATMGIADWGAAMNAR